MQNIVIKNLMLELGKLEGLYLLFSQINEFDVAISDVEIEMSQDFKVCQFAVIYNLLAPAVIENLHVSLGVITIMFSENGIIAYYNSSVTLANSTIDF